MWRLLMESENMIPQAENFQRIQFFLNTANFQPKQILN